VNAAGVSVSATPLTVPDSVEYITGSLASLFNGDGDRVVLAFSSGISAASPGSKLVILGVSGTTLSVLSPATLDRFETSTAADNIHIVSITRFNFVLAYRIPRDMTTMVRLVTFASTDSVSLVAQPSVQLITGAVLTYMRVARLNDTRAIIGARSILENDRVYGAVLDVTTNTSILAVGPIAVISAGTSPNFSLPLGVTGAGPDRAVFTYYDYNGYPTVTDVGIYATSIVNGREQPLFRGTNATGASVGVIALNDTLVIAITQPAFTGSARGANAFRCLLYGGPVMLGIAKTSAVEGQLVTVAIAGAIDGYSSLRPGSPYYARYDGGIDVVVNENSGVSSQLVGRALTSDVLLATIGADVDGLKSVSDVANYLALSASDRITPLAAQLSNLTSVVSAFPSRLSKGTVYYYNWFSTYTSQRSNPPWISTDSFLYLGISVQTWKFGAEVNTVSASKDLWRNFFTKRSYGGFNALIFADEYFPQDTNGRLSITSRIGVCIFRIRNTLSTNVTWPVSFWYSAYPLWMDIASVALNGVNQFNSAFNNYLCYHCQQSLTLSIPPNRVSTVMFAVGSGPVSTTRTMLLSFISNSLSLPNGLFYVDDMDIAQGGWEA